MLNGFHAVVYSDQVKEQVEKAKEENKRLESKKLLWRASSTSFRRQNSMLQPVNQPFR